MTDSAPDRPVETVVFESPKAWVQVIETPRKFYYLRRKHRDSVGVFLLRQQPNSSNWEVLVRMQPLPVHNADLDDEFDGEMMLFPCPITGGLESKDEDPYECAVREVMEEAGYPLESLQPLGQYIVGTQTDETVYLFWQDVTQIIPVEATQDGSYFESISKNIWQPLEFLKSCDYSGCQIGYYRLCEALQARG
jgi:8-oxo-dGTP diphosphatase